MLAFMCSLVGSSIWVIGASKYGLPVSSSHAIVGAVAGAGIACYGWGVLNWPSLIKVFISWIASPGIAAVLGALFYGITKYSVLNHQNSLQRGLIAIPFYFMFAISVCVFYVVLKAPKGIDISKAKNQTPQLIGTALGITFGVGLLVGLFCYLCLVPWLRRKLVEEEEMKWYHAFYTPFVPKQPRNEKLQEMLDRGANHEVYDDSENGTVNGKIPQEPEDKTMLQKTYVYLTRGLFMDVASAQSDHVKGVHAVAVKHESKTEYLYSFLQVCTAAFASFAHGSNDVANAAGPLSAIYSIYETGTIPGGKNAFDAEKSKVPIPLWILALMGFAIDAGLILYGYKVMRNLGILELIV
jgi:phosphate/sulfate permease